MKTGGQKGGICCEKKFSFHCQDLGIDKSMTVFIPQRYGNSQKCEKTKNNICLFLDMIYLSYICIVKF